MTRRISRRPLLLLAATVAMTLRAATGPCAPLETSVEKARAMLIKEDLGDGVYVFRAPSDLDYWTSSNSVVIVNDHDVVVFDSPTRAVTARAVIAEIRALTPKPVTVLINSHWHQDHWSGNDEYAKAFPGLRIIATEQTRDFMSRMPARFFVAEVENSSKRHRAELEAATTSGKLADGSPLTAQSRASLEAALAVSEQAAVEVAALPRVLPNLVFRDEMTFWSGKREFRLLSVTGDATASAVLFLPGSRILATGDVLVSPEDGNGPPPWTTNSYAVTPWLESLRRLAALDPAVIVPGQGPSMHDRAYLERTIELYAAIVGQVRAALARGLVTEDEVQKVIDVDRIGLAYTPGAGLSESFHSWVGRLTKKAMQEAQDGAAQVNR
jgi:glyoxylase-like metal-dependent hydrolase (beta-lactamase superfamily II)